MFVLRNAGSLKLKLKIKQSYKLRLTKAKRLSYAEQFCGEALGVYSAAYFPCLFRLLLY